MLKILNRIIREIVTIKIGEAVRASFLFVGDLNGHHQEWLGSTTTNRLGVASFNFATVSVCDQLVVGPTHARGGTLHLLMTDVPGLVRVSVVEPMLLLSLLKKIGNKRPGEGD